MRLNPLAARTHQADLRRGGSHVEVVRLDFLPGMITPYHEHPVPVIGYVARGAFDVQIEGQPMRHYKTGDSIYEPANTRMAHFDNVSKTEPAVLIATYLAGPDDKTLVALLPK
ncbi:MAG TPA: cupin domain-containing protein [Rhizomicrobium sp.]|nr:cupin domain-containing protein [Rhizomicrobium sp.]